MPLWKKTNKNFIFFFKKMIIQKCSFVNCLIQSKEIILIKEFQKETYIYLCKKHFRIYTGKIKLHKFEENKTLLSYSSMTSKD